MSVVYNEPSDFTDCIRMRYQCKERKNRKNEFIREQGDLQREIALLKDEIEHLKRDNRELVKLFCSGSKMVCK